MSHRRKGAISGAIATLIVFSGGSAAHANAGYDIYSSVGSAEDGELLSAYHRISERANDKDALGVYYDELDKDFVVVLPAAGSGSASTLADFNTGDLTPVVRRSHTTQAQIDTVNSRIRAETQRNKTAGYVFGSTFDLVRDVMVVESDAPMGLLESLSSGLSIKVEYLPGTGGRTSRQFDPAPHRGGAAITVNGLDGTRCSSGFTVKDPQVGDPFMVTAAHCTPTDILGVPVANTGSQEYIGHLYRWNWPERDIALIYGRPYGPYIYVGDATGAQKRVIGATDPIVGRTNYCRSGIATNEKCGQKVIDLEGQFCKITCQVHLITYTGVSALGGDSGAPFYSYNSDRSGVQIHGIHIATSGVYQRAEKWSLIASTQGVEIAT